MTTPRPTHAVLSVTTDLTELLDGARKLEQLARDARLTATRKQVRRLALQLDAARTALIQEGEAYLDVALAYLEAAALRLVAHAAHIGRAAGCAADAVALVELDDEL